MKNKAPSLTDMGSNQSGILNVLDENTRRVVDAIVQAGTAENTRRAYQRDLAYITAWLRASGQYTAEQNLTFPLSIKTVIEFITDHLGGMKAAVERQLLEAGVKRKRGPHGLSTIERRVAVLSWAHTRQGYTRENPCQHPDARYLLSKARRALAKLPDGRPRKKQAATADIIMKLADTCCDPQSVMDIRDQAIMLVGFAAGGRRRSEIAALELGDAERVRDGFLLTIRHSKTDQEGVGLTVPVLDAAAEALERWFIRLQHAGIAEGALFRRVHHRSQRIGAGLGDRAIAEIIKRRAAQAGLDPHLFSGHSLRSGFMTEAGRQGKSLPDAMALSGHKSYSIAVGYHQAGDALQNPAGRLLRRRRRHTTRTRTSQR